MTKQILLALVLSYITASPAQAVFEKGYFIDNSGKRNECFVEDSRKNPKEFRYKSNPDDEEIKIKTIAEVAEFGLDNITSFKRLTVKMDRSSDDIQKLKKDKLPVFTTETLYLKLLVDGKIKLYLYSEDNLTRFFYETSTLPVEQLVYLRYIAQNGEMGSNNQFRQQLLLNANPLGLPEKVFKKMKYYREDLTEYFLRSNERSKPTKKDLRQTMLENRKTKPFREFFGLKVTPGYDKASVNITFPHNSLFSTSNATIEDKLLRIGVEIECFPFRKRKFSFFVNPMYAKFSGSGIYTESKVFTQETHFTSISHSALEISFGIRYAYAISKNSRLFANLAFAGDLMPKTKISTDTSTYQADGLASNIVFGFGYGYKKLSLEVRMSTKKEISTNVQITAEYKATGVILGYNFL
jgi:hypothetical protein